MQVKREPRIHTYLTAFPKSFDRMKMIVYEHINNKHIFESQIMSFVYLGSVAVQLCAFYLVVLKSALFKTFIKDGMGLGYNYNRQAFSVNRSLAEA